MRASRVATVPYMVPMQSSRPCPMQAEPFFPALSQNAGAGRNPRLASAEAARKRTGRRERSSGPVHPGGTPQDSRTASLWTAVQFGFNTPPAPRVHAFPTKWESASDIFRKDRPCHVFSGLTVWTETCASTFSFPSGCSGRKRPMPLRGIPSRKGIPCSSSGKG